MAPASDVSQALATLQARWGTGVLRRGSEVGLMVDGALARVAAVEPGPAPELTAELAPGRSADAAWSELRGDSGWPGFDCRHPRKRAVDHEADLAAPAPQHARAPAGLERGECLGDVGCGSHRTSNNRTSVLLVKCFARCFSAGTWSAMGASQVVRVCVDPACVAPVEICVTEERRGSHS